ncbi:MAG: cyclic pyranopterin monophosphate synthase MoaC [Chloroflexota bacterium]
MSNPAQEPHLTHLDASGRAHMVDVGGKSVTAREAEARCWVAMLPETIRSIRDNRAEKGDVLGVARVAGILAAKSTSQLIPLCHGLALTGIDLQFSIDEEYSRVHIVSRVRTEGRTGVEMEALTAVTVAALTIYDMCKAVDRGMAIERVRLTYKSGGKSGVYRSE